MDSYAGICLESLKKVRITAVKLAAHQTEIKTRIYYYM
jgi:hypothetical protein